MSNENINPYHYIADNAQNNYNGREIVIWGKNCYRMYLVTDSLIKRGLSIAFYVDSNKSLWNETDCFSPSVLSKNSSKYYVIVLCAFYQSIKDSLSEYGYEKDKDYQYFHDCIIESRDDYYEDEHGNKLIGDHKGLQFKFCGFNSLIEIEDNTCFRNTYIYMLSNSSVHIGKDCSFKEGTFDIKNNVRAVFGNNFSIEPNYWFNLADYFELLIGKDCMFSYSISLESEDWHSIFDVRSSKNINYTESIMKNRKITIGDHVWIGRNVLLLYNTNIRCGSIVGANSVVKGSFPNNCTIAGNPARVRRKDIAWSRKQYTENILDCGEEYIRLTEETDE